MKGCIFVNYRKLVGNAAIAFLAQGVSLGVSVVMSLLVPKVLGIASFGYWQLFIFYVSYSGFFHFGLNDGVYLLEGGKNRDNIDKSIVNSQFRVAIAMQLIVGMAACLISAVAAPDEERAFVIAAFSFYTVLFNLQGYLGYVFQALNETKLFSFSSMLERLVFLLPLLGFILFRISDFRYYVVLYCLSRACSLSYCCWHARDFLRAGSLPGRESLKVAFSSIKVGFGLMLANVANILVLGIARAIVDFAWGIEAFGSVSFSLSMVNFFTSFVSQASMVLFPALRQGNENERRSFYRGIRDAMEIAFPGIYLLYFPVAALLSKWLPQYSASMVYFILLIPVCVFNTKMDICCTTYFKVLRKERLLLRVNVYTVVASSLLSIIGLFCFGSVEAVIMGAVMCIVGRSLWSERYLDKMLAIESTQIPFQEILLTFAFILLTLCLPGVIAELCYLILFVIYLYINKDLAFDLFRRIKSALNKKPENLIF